MATGLWSGSTSLSSGGGLWKGFAGFSEGGGLSPGSGGTPASAAIAMPASVWAFGASSMSGGQSLTGTATTEDSLTNVVRAIEGLPPGSLAYTVATNSGSQTSRVTPGIDYNLTGVNSAHKIRNRGQGGATSGSGGTIVSIMTAAIGSVGASDFVILHQGDNGVSPTATGVPEVFAAAYASMRSLAGARPFVQIVNTRAGRGSAGSLTGEPPGHPWAIQKAISFRIQSDLNPGRVIDFNDALIDRSTGLNANELVDRSQGVIPRTHAMNDGSHQSSDAATPTPAKGYNLQSDVVMTPMIDAWAGGTPFPLKQIIETASPATPAANDAVGSIVAYGSGGTFALDASNTQSDYAVSSSGAITRIGSTLPARDVTWAAVKTSKDGRFDKVQPFVGICERAAPGVSKMVAFDGASVLSMPDSRMTNASRLTVLMRLKQTVASTQNVYGAMSGNTQCSLRLLTSGAVEVGWRNPANGQIVNQTTAANFRTVDPPRWLAICLDFSAIATNINKIVTWVDPASPTTIQFDALAVETIRLDAPIAFGALSSNLTANSTMGAFQIGDWAIFRDSYIDFTDIARRQEVSETDGAPKAAWVSGGAVTNGITPEIYMGGNAGDWRQGRLRGSLVPATPGAAGAYLGFTCRERSAGVPGFLVTV